MIITQVHRGHRSKHVPPWPLHPNALWIGGTLLFLGALAWMVSIELPCGRDECGGLDGMKESRVFGCIWLAMVVLSAMYAWRYGHWLRTRRKAYTPGLFLQALFASVALAGLLSVHLIAFANFTGPRRSVHLQGAIVGKRIQSGKSPSYDVTLRDLGSGRDVAVCVDAWVYRAVRMGDQASCEYRMGRWGLIYRWRYGEPRGCAFQHSTAPMGAESAPSRCKPVSGCGEG